MKYCFVVFNDVDNNINSWINIGYIASYLENHSNFSVMFKFYRVEEIERAIQEINFISPDIIGLPILQHNFNVSLIFCKKIKEYLPKTFIVAGNKDGVFYGEYIMSHNNAIDAIILGEGEITNCELCNRISNNIDIYNCPGLLLRKNGRLIQTPKRALIENLDDLPYPHRGYRVGNSNIYNIIGSRGCIGNCSFCEANTVFSKNTFSKSPVRCRSISNILDEVSSLLNGKNFIVANFLDSTFCCNDAQAISRLDELYIEIKKRNLNFQFNLNVRSEQVDNQFIKCLINLSKVGLDSILVGIETGNRDDIKLYNKGASLDQHVKAINSLNLALEQNPNLFGVEYGFINFNPYSTLENLQINADFIKTNNIMLFPHDILSKLRISGSAPITNKILKDGLLTSDENFPIIDPYAYRYADERIYKLYEVLEQAYSHLKSPNTSVILSKIRRYALKHDFDQNKLTSVLSLNKNICETTLCIFEHALSIIKNGSPLEPLLCYVEEQRKNLQKYYNEVKKIENRVSIELFKIGELPYHN